MEQSTFYTIMTTLGFISLFTGTVACYSSYRNFKIQHKWFKHYLDDVKNINED